MNNNAVKDIVTNTKLTYSQEVAALASLAESEDNTLDYGKEWYQAKAEGVLCDLNEGVLPYRPRYVIPDYRKLMTNGCKFLNLEPAEDLYEALNNLLIFYKHVPSITHFPVYLGGFDDLLENFVKNMDYRSAKKALKMFLRHIDSTLTDSFVHANIGPKETVTGNIILELTEEMQLAVPNITLKFDPEITPDNFAEKAAKTMLKTAKPSFANHQMFVSEWSEDYVIASCYNGLLIGGGGFTLPRLRMYECSLKAKDIDDFLDNVLPYYADLQLKFMDQRIEFLVEESSFFKSNFLVKEGFIELDRFTGMFGMVGLAECVNHLCGIDNPDKGFGHNEEADNLGIRIMEKLTEIVSDHKTKYCKATGNRYRLHAQVGIDTDKGTDSPGTRVPVGSEPEMFDQIMVNQKFHRFFPTGTGDIFNFEETWLKTPDAVLDIIKGSLEGDLRYFSGYLENNDVVRVTGYLVKKSELEKYDNNEQSLNSCTAFGQGARDYSKALDRRVVKDDLRTSK